MMDKLQPHRIAREKLDPLWPTHAHPPRFWESLGRTVATFGLLEDVLARAIYALSGTREIDENQDAEHQVREWISKLEMRLTDMLGSLISHFETELKSDDRIESGSFDDLIKTLRDASQIRNVLCHASWNKPDEFGGTIPNFIDRKLRVFETRVDVEFLDQVQSATSDLIWDVVEVVTYLGYQFPGSNSPGYRIASNLNPS